MKRLILLGGVFAAMAGADGITYTEVYNGALDGSIQGPPAVSAPANGMSVNSASGTSSGGGYSQTWSGYAAASASALHASVSTTISCVTSSCGTYAVPQQTVPATGAAAWADSVITVQPGPQMASLNFVFSVDGTTATSGAMTASAALTGETCGLGGGYCYCCEQRTMRNVFLAPNGTSTATLNMTPWALNQPFNLEFILSAAADGSNGLDASNNYLVTGPGSANINFSDTVSLVAIQAVDANGNVVNDGTVIFDDSGTNLPNTIAATPEPATFGGVGMGLLVFGVVRSKRRR